MFGYFKVLNILAVFHMNDWNPKMGLVTLINRVCRDLSWILFESISKGAAYLKIDNIILIDNMCFVLKVQYLNTSHSIEDL